MAHKTAPVKPTAAKRTPKADVGETSRVHRGWRHVRPMGTPGPADTDEETIAAWHAADGEAAAALIGKALAERGWACMDGTRRGGDGPADAALGDADADAAIGDSLAPPAGVDDLFTEPIVTGTPDELVAALSDPAQQDRVVTLLPVPVSPDNAAGSPADAQDLAQHNTLRADHATLKRELRNRTLDAEIAESAFERSKDGLLTFAGEEWVDAEITACASAWLTIDDMKALERLKERHKTLEELKTTKASPRAEAAFSGARKALDDAKVALAVFEENHALLLGLKPKAKVVEEPKPEEPPPVDHKEEVQALHDSLDPNHVETKERRKALAKGKNGAAKIDDLAPSLSPALAKVGEEIKAEEAKPMSEGARKLEALLADRKSPTAVKVDECDIPF